MNRGDRNSRYDDVLNSFENCFNYDVIRKVMKAAVVVLLFTRPVLFMLEPRHEGLSRDIYYHPFSFFIISFLF